MWKIGAVNESENHSVMSDSLWPMNETVHGTLQARILEWIAFLFSRGSSQTRDWTQVSWLQADSLPAETIRKPKNIGVGSPSILWGIFLTQESNQGLLHCSRFFTNWPIREAQLIAYNYYTDTIQEFYSWSKNYSYGTYILLFI